MTNRYTGGFWDFKEEKVVLLRWEDGNRVQESHDFDWYFFLKESDFEKVDGQELDGFIDRAEPAGKFVKLFMPYFTKDERRQRCIDFLRENEVEPLEADVYPVDRFVFDNDIEIETAPHLLYFDLETDSRQGGWDNIELHRILTIAFCSETGETKCLAAKTADDKGEKELLERFFDVINEHDVLVGWNSTGYDEPLLRARAKRLGLYPNWRSVGFLDLMELFKRYFMRDDSGSGVRISFSLENIGQTVLGKGKMKDLPKHRLIDVFKSDLPKLIEYNKRDVEMLRELEERLHYINAQAVLSKLCNRFLSDISCKSQNLVDGFVLKHAAKENKVHFRTKKEFGGDEKQIEGAFVMAPVLGLHEGICDLDFSSLYPSIVISWNISPETKLEGTTDRPVAVAANNAQFCTDEKGVFPAISELALKHRQEWKDKAKQLENAGQEDSLDFRLAQQRSNAWKVLANSMYGVLSSKFSRYYDPQCGEAITITGKTIIQKVIAFAESKGIPVIYSDTDSVFIKESKEVAEVFAKKAELHISDFAKGVGAKPGLIRLKLDAVFERILFTSKKRYAGKKSNGKIDVRGLELIRSDGCRYARELQRRIIDFCLEAKSPTVEVAMTILKRWAEKLFAGEVDSEDLQLTQTLSKSLESYKVNLVHTRIAKELIAKGKEVYIGMKIPYILTGKVDGKATAVHVSEYAGKYDAHQYWSGNVYPATQRILEAVFPKQKQKWKRLESFDPNPAQKVLFAED